MQAIEKQDQLQLVAFRLAAEEYAIPIEMVESIIKLGPLTSVPGSPSYVRGVMNLRGRIMSVIDLRQRFGMPAEEDKPEGRILVVQYGDTTIGLLVDSVSEVFNLDEMEFQPPPPELGNGAVGGVDGIVHAGDRLIVLLNVESILRSSADIESMSELATNAS
jgi:purine-binding chemotaxis protein CheW